MSPLSFILIIASILFLLFAIDGLQRRRLNFIHFLIFVGGTALILVTLFYPGFQEKFASIFGVARLADIVVYGALIVLAYFYFELLNELTKQKFHTTRLISALSMERAQIGKIAAAQDEKDRFCFLIRAYNEEKTIGGVIDEIIKAGYSKIVIVNDGSRDGTVAQIEERQEKHPHAHIIVLTHLINR